MNEVKNIKLNMVFKPKRGYMEDFLRIVEETGGIEGYDEVEKIYLKKDSGEAYFIKKENNGAEGESKEPFCFERSRSTKKCVSYWIT